MRRSALLQSKQDSEDNRTENIAQLKAFKKWRRNSKLYINMPRTALDNALRNSVLNEAKRFYSGTSKNLAGKNRSNASKTGVAVAAEFDATTSQTYPSSARTTRSQSGNPAPHSFHSLTITDVAGTPRAASETAAPFIPSTPAAPTPKGPSKWSRASLSENMLPDHADTAHTATTRSKRGKPTPSNSFS
jgi:hypothetical protein